jgi:hypothetical protein
MALTPGASTGREQLGCLLVVPHAASHPDARAAVDLHAPAQRVAEAKRRLGGGLAAWPWALKLFPRGP